VLLYIFLIYFIAINYLEEIHNFSHYIYWKSLEIYDYFDTDSKNYLKFFIFSKLFHRFELKSIFLYKFGIFFGEILLLFLINELIR
jgi:hypothetical protein